MFGSFSGLLNGWRESSRPSQPFREVSPPRSYAAVVFSSVAISRPLSCTLARPLCPKAVEKAPVKGTSPSSSSSRNFQKDWNLTVTVHRLSSSIFWKIIFDDLSFSLSRNCPYSPFGSDKALLWYYSLEEKEKALSLRHFFDRSEKVAVLSSWKPEDHIQVSEPLVKDCWVGIAGFPPNLWSEDLFLKV